jgi:hypothetical protein
MLGIIGSVDRLVFSIRPNTRCGCTLSNASGYYVDKRNFNSCNKMACMQHCVWSQPHCELKMGSTFINSWKILWVPKKFGKERLLLITSDWTIMMIDSCVTFICFKMYIISYLWFNSGEGHTFSAQFEYDN